MSQESYYCSLSNLSDDEDGSERRFPAVCAAAAQKHLAGKQNALLWVQNNKLPVHENAKQFNRLI